MPPSTSATGGYVRPTTAPPPDDALFSRQINELVVGITGLPGSLVRPRWATDPLPTPGVGTDWVAVGVVDVDEPGTPLIQHVGRAFDEEGVEIAYDGRDDLVTHEHIRILASFYGPNANRNAGLFRRGLQVPQNQEILFLNKMGVMDIQPRRHVPEPVNDQWYNRVDVEFRIAREVDESYPILNILTAQGTFRIDGAVPEQTDWNTENNR
jgi:hypothetical protein